MAVASKYQGADRMALQALLRGAGFRATEGRLVLLAVLKRSPKPLSVETITRQISSHLDEANVYRALEALHRAGVVARVDLQHPHVHYEFKNPADEHHHIVCTSCHRVEKFSGCGYDALVRHALGQARGFARITDHSVELFGVCTVCANA